MLDRLGESLNKNQEYFEKNLDKESYDFLVQLVESGEYSWKEIKRKVKVEKNKIIWKGKLDIEGTKVKKIKVKRIEGDVKAEGVESLEEIEVEEIGGNLYIEGTKVKKIKAKRIEGYVFAKGVESLEEIEVEEIGGNLYIEGTKVKRIKAKRIKWSVRAKGVESLEEIEVEEEIGGDLDIRGTRIDFQLKIIKKIRNKTLEVKGKFSYDKEIISKFADKEGKVKDIRNVISFLKERYGESLKNIENEGLKKEAINMLEYLNNKIKKEIQTKIVEYANRGGEIEGQEKKLMIGKIMKKIVEYANKGGKKEAINMLEYLNNKIKKEIQTKIVEYTNRGGEIEGQEKKLMIGKIMKKIVEYANKGGKKEGKEKKLMIGKIMKKIVEYTNKGQEKEEIVKKIVGYSEEYEKWKKFYNNFMGKY